MDLKLHDLKNGQLIIHEGVEKIPNRAFENKKIKKIKFPDSLKEIGNCAFRYNNIEELDISKNVLKIGNGAFKDNIISKLNLNSKLITIGNYAFEDNMLQNINIPKTVSSIGIDAFDITNNTKIKYGQFKINNKYIKKYNTLYLPQIYKWLEVLGSDYDFDNIGIELLENVTDKNIIKNVNNNKIIFNSLIKEGYTHTQKNTLYKLCFSLGLFSLEGNIQKEIYTFLNKYFNENSIYNLDEIYNKLNIDKFNLKKAKLIIKVLSEIKYYDKQKLNLLLPIVYNEYNSIENFKSNYETQDEVMYNDVLNYVKNTKDNVLVKKLFYI